VKKNKKKTAKQKWKKNKKMTKKKSNVL
jgi:hypothetical protein